MKTIKNLLIILSLTLPLLSSARRFGQLFTTYNAQFEVQEISEFCMEQNFDGMGNPACLQFGTKITLAATLNHCADTLEVFEHSSFDLNGTLQLLIKAKANTGLTRMGSIECITAGISIKVIIVEKTYELDEIEIARGEVEPRAAIPTLIL